MLPLILKTGFDQRGGSSMQQHDEAGHDQDGTSNDQSDRRAHLADLLGYLGAGELCLGAYQRGELAHEVGEDFRNGTSIIHGRLLAARSIGTPANTLARALEKSGKREPSECGGCEERRRLAAGE